MRRWIRQLFALCRKNIIVLSNHYFLNLFRCVILPVLFALFLANAPGIFTPNNKLGLGTAIPVYKLADVFDPKSTIVYVDATNGTDSLAVLAIMTVVMRNFSQPQKDAVLRLDSETEIAAACPHSFQIVSNCYGAVVFRSVNLKNPIQYTLRADMGRLNVDVQHHTSDAEMVSLPLQWAVDSAIIELISGVSVDPPIQQPFTKLTNSATKQRTRRSFLGSIRELVVLAFFAGQMGVVYHMAGEVMFERAATLTSHLTAMGCMASARILSWHMCISGAYLPSWIASALLWRWSIFTHTPLGLFIGVHLVAGFSLASWSLLVAQPFYKSPQLAAIACSVLAVILGILGLLFNGTWIAAVVYTVICPPAFYVFALKSLAAWELAEETAQLFTPDTDGFVFGPVLIAAAATIVIFPLLALWLESHLHSVQLPDNSRTRAQFHKASRPLSVWGNASVSIRGLHKTYSTGIFKKRTHTAIESLDLDVPASGIHVFCGRNGSGKTTLLRIIAGLESASKGEVTYADGMPRPAAGDLGIVPQKNVLWNELTCAQHLTLWGALKRPTGAPSEEVGELLQECGLLDKKHAAAGSLSGGQKRRLQLAIGLVGGSQLVLIDEATSGVDPISRRAIWRALVQARTNRTIIYTTHFLDEADLLADHVSIMTAPGRIVARGSPVMLKTGHSQGYVITCTFDNSTQASLDVRRHQPVLTAVRRYAPAAVLLNGGQEDDGISLRTHNPRVVSQVLRLLEKDKRRLGLRSFDIRATTLSDVFLKLMGEDGTLEKLYSPTPNRMFSSPTRTSVDQELEDLSYAPSTFRASMSALSEPSEYSHAPRRLKRKEPSEARDHMSSRMSHSLVAIPETQFRDSNFVSRDSHLTKSEWYTMDRPVSLPFEAQNLYTDKLRHSTVDLTEGRPTSVFLQAGVLWKKRMLVARRGWIVPFLAAVLAIGGACIPLFFIHDRQNKCVRNEHDDMRYSLFLPISPFAWNKTGRTYVAPPGALESLQYPIPGAYPLADMSAFNTAIDATYPYIDTGGISILADNTTTFAWEASPGNIAGNVMLNLASNTLFNIALNQSQRTIGYGPKINGEIQPMPSVTPRGIGPANKWISFFGSSMAAWPAMAALYVTKERASHVQAMQLSNGFSPAGLWIGHLLYEIPIILIISGAITGIFASTGQFFNLELMFAVIVLYGIDATLLSFVASLFIRSPIAAFAIIAGYQCITFLGYLAGVFFTLATVFSYTAGNVLTTMHYLVAIISPVASVVRAAFISTNVFYTLCSDHGNLDASSNLNAMDHFGAPIAYTVIHSVFLLAFLIWYDSGMPWLPREWYKHTTDYTQFGKDAPYDVQDEAARVARSFDSLRISHASKTHGKTQALEDVTFGLSSGIFGLLGSNGGGKCTPFSRVNPIQKTYLHPPGKTTLFNLIQGHLLPDRTDPACNVFIDGRSIITGRNKARSRLGVCPQATALESVLTVREHLEMYARCKGLRGEDLDRNVECIMAATQLLPHSHKYANKLSGGNQRKLSLAIALLGSPAVVLIDEFSTGVDPSTKRDLWDTLRRVSTGKAVLLTTHAMEEVTALADRIGIISQRLLAIGTIEDLISRYPLYEVHFSSSSPGEEARMREVMRDFPPNWRASDDLTARYEVELDGGQTLADIFEILHEHLGPAGVEACTVERISLESVFLRITQQHLDNKNRRGPYVIDEGNRFLCF